MNDKVILVNVRDKGRLGMEWELPINHLHLSHSLRKSGYIPAIYEVDREYADELVERIIDENPLFVGMGGIFDCFAPVALEICNKIKTKTSIPVLWGGSAVTMSPGIYLKEDVIDFVCRGEGEIPVVQFAEYLNGKIDIRRVGGLGYKDNGKEVFNDTWYAENLGDIGFDLDALNFLENDKRGFRKYIRDGVLYSLRATKGCPYQCTFCYNSSIRNRFRMFEVDKVVDVLQAIKSQHEFNSVRLVDDLLFVKKSWAYELLEKLYENGITIFNVDARAADITEPFMDKMREYKVRSLFFGFESYDDRILKLYNKRVDVKTLNNTFRVSNLYPDIQLSCQIIIGAPGTTKEETIKECLSYLMLLDKYSVDIYVNTFKPIPGTPLYFKAIENGFKPLQNLDELSKWFLRSFEKYDNKTYPWIAKNDKEVEFYNKIRIVSQYCVITVRNKLLRKLYWPFFMRRMEKRIKKMDLKFLWELYPLRLLSYIYKVRIYFSRICK